MKGRGMTRLRTMCAVAALVAVALGAPAGAAASHGVTVGPTVVVSASADVLATAGEDLVAPGGNGRSGTDTGLGWGWGG